MTVSPTAIETGGEGGLLQTNNYSLPLLCVPTWLSALQNNLCVAASLHYYYLCLPRHSTPTVHTSENDTGGSLCSFSVMKVWSCHIELKCDLCFICGQELK